MPSLSHLDDSGAARMVDVGAKAITRREATASGFLRLRPATLDLIRRDAIAKGNVLAVARVAGIQAAKATSTLIPLCHHLPLSAVSVDFSLQPAGITLVATARTTSQTGVEMEVLTAVAVAALTLYDMLKAVDAEMVIEGIQLNAKSKSPIESQTGERGESTAIEDASRPDS
ncbi:MAG: cyclic pyranopterin monophosphate synthase MoaC [Verrucomicrobiales bacterium]